jgi:acyl-[acyl-carrier-protein]-phospholipid O-acyltransferase/long-chain-fatty-acid--[acyl-carrier-protein] ligase
LAGTEVLAQHWTERLPVDCERVGVLLPNVSAFPTTLLSLWSLNKVPAILNFTFGSRTMLDCIELAGLKNIITSRGFLERTNLKIDLLLHAGIQLFYLEDVRTSISKVQKLAAWLRMTLNPRLLLPRLTATQHGPCNGPGEDVAVIVFTSGSEGGPKGVELSHANLLSNIRQMLALSDVQETDRAFNCLPLFHSFGLTVGLLLPLVRGLYVFLYPSPLHYRKVPAIFYDRDCTILLSTNTFLNGYARKADAYDFRTLRYLFAGAEKLQDSTARVWSEYYGARVLEGYGATECSPCICANAPISPRRGSVGRLLPGMECRLEPVEGLEEGGRMFVRGPNVMRGYLNPDADARFKSLEGWYDTGDIARQDADGYVYILGRLKRFAKVSGEMVSLTAVEDALAGAFPQFGLRCLIAILTRPDEHKGEMLVAVTNEPNLSLDEIRRVVQAKGLGNLCLPRDIKYLKRIPKLGTGKINHRELAKSFQSVEQSAMSNVITSFCGKQPVMQ